MTKLILENLGFPSALKGKPLALLGVAQGRIGAIRTIEQLRGVAAHMGAITLPFAVSIAGVQNLALEPKEELAAETQRALTSLAEALIDVMKTYVCPKCELESTLRDGKVEPWVGVL